MVPAQVASVVGRRPRSCLVAALTRERASGRPVRGGARPGAGLGRGLPKRLLALHPGLDCMAQGLHGLLMDDEARTMRGVVFGPLQPQVNATFQARRTSSTAPPRQNAALRATQERPASDKPRKAGRGCAACAVAGLPTYEQREGQAVPVQAQHHHRVLPRHTHRQQLRTTGRCGGGGRGVAGRGRGHGVRMNGKLGGT